MNRQIVQIFHNLIGKGRKSDGRANERNPEPGLIHDADQNESGDSIKQGELLGQMIDLRTFESIVNESVGQSQEQGCLMTVDVDKFRDVNHLYGRDAGDAVLCCVERVLRDVFGGHACLCSPGGDIFVLWLSEISRDSADEMRRRIGMVNDRLLHPDAGIPPVSLSVGAAFCKLGDDNRSLVKRANKALYQVKERGRCGCELSL